MSVYWPTPALPGHPAVCLPPAGWQSPHPEVASPQLGDGVPGAPHHPAVRLTARLESLWVEAEYLLVPAGSPQSQGMTAGPLTTIVLHLALLTAAPLTGWLPVLAQAERMSRAAGTPAGDGVTLAVLLPPEVRRLRLTAALSVAGRVDQQLLARLAVTVLSSSPGHHAAPTAPRHVRQLNLTQILVFRVAGTGPGLAGDLLAPHYQPLLGLARTSGQQVVTLTVPGPEDLAPGQTGRLSPRHLPRCRKPPLLLRAGAGGDLRAGWRPRVVLKPRADSQAVTTEEDFVIPAGTLSLQSVALQVCRPAYLSCSTLDSGGGGGGGGNYWVCWVLLK